MSIRKMEYWVYRLLFICALWLIIFSFYSNIRLSSFQKTNQALLENGVQVEADIIDTETESRIISAYPKTTITVGFYANHEYVQSELILCGILLSLDSDKATVSYNPQNPAELGSEDTAESIQFFIKYNRSHIYWGFALFLSDYLLWRYRYFWAAYEEQE